MKYDPRYDKKNYFDGVPEDRAAVDNIFRLGVTNQMRLNINADQKAGQMITVSAIVFSVTAANFDNPILMYPLSKYLAEKYFESVCKSYELNVVSLRLANIFGRKQDYFRKQIPFLGYLIKNSLLKKDLTLYAKGEFKRDYLFIDDLSRLILLILKHKKFKNKSKLYEVLNVGSGYKYSVPDFVSLMQKILNLKIKIIWGKKTDYWKKYEFLYKSKIKFDKKLIEKEVKKKVFLNLSKVQKIYGWKSKYKIDQGLKECIFSAKKILKIK